MDLCFDSVDPLQAEGKLAGNEVPYSHLSTPCAKGRTQEMSKHFQLFDSLVRNWISRPGLPGTQLTELGKVSDGTADTQVARALSAPSPGKQGWKLCRLAAPEPVCTFMSHNDQFQQVPRHGVPSTGGLAGGTHMPPSMPAVSRAIQK